MGWFEAKFGEWVVRNRWWVIIATIVFAIGAASGIRYLTFNMDNRVFFSKENPQLQALEALENTYTKDNNIFFVIAPKNGAVFTREMLSVIEELTNASWKIPYSSRVDSITNFQHTWAEEDDLIVEDLVLDAENLTDADIERIKGIALSEPLLVDRIVSPSGHVTAVNVNIFLPGKSMDEVPEISTYTNKMVEDLRRSHPELDIYLSGGIEMNNAFGKVSQDDISTLVPIMLIVILVIVGVALRSFIGTFSTLIIIAFSMITALGLAGWVGISLNAASVNAPTIILTLAVADSIHIMATMFQRMRKGDSKYKAIAESLRVNLQPVFLTSFTTAIGFLSMNFSDAPPFRDLGNMVAAGVMLAFVYSILLLPALLAVLPIKVKSKVRAGNTAYEHLADFVVKRRKPLMWGSIVVIAALTMGMTKIELNDNFIKYFDERYAVRRAADFVSDNLTGLDVIEYSLESGESGGINNPEYLAKVEEFAQWYSKQPKAVHVTAITNTFKRLNKNMHGDDEAYYRIPDSRELAAQYLLLYEMSLPYGLDLNNQINIDKSSTRMIVIVNNTTARELRDMDEKARAWLKENASKTMFAYGTGLSIIWANISKRNINSMLIASFGALILISGVLILALRNLRLGALSLIPNLVPAFMAFGVWGLLVGRVGLGLSVIVAMTLGIVVDDTVHFMSKYLRARREHKMSPEDAVRYSFNTVGSALMISTIALVAGFSVLAFSGFKLSSEMGLMTAITISIALILDFLFLPTLLMKAEEK